MKLRLQFGGWLLALVISAGLALQCAAQNPRTDREQSRGRSAASHGRKRAGYSQSRGLPKRRAVMLKRLAATSMRRAILPQRILYRGDRETRATEGIALRM